MEEKKPSYGGGKGVKSLGSGQSREAKVRVGVAEDQGSKSPGGQCQGGLRPVAIGPRAKRARSCSQDLYTCWDGSKIVIYCLTGKCGASFPGGT